MSATKPKTPATFIAGGRTYTLRLDGGTIRRLKAETGWDFFAIADDGEALTRDCLLFSHRLIPVLTAWLRTERTAAGLSEEQFADLFDGDILDAATEAVWVAFADFFRRHPLSMRVAELGAKAVMEEIEAEIKKAMRTRSGTGTVGNDSSTVSPDSSESTPPG